MRFQTVPELLRQAVSRYGDAPAIVCADRSESFKQLSRSVLSVAEVLRRRGLGAGERVLIAGANSIPLVHAWLGCIAAGAVPAAVNPQLTEPEMEYLRDDLKPALTLLGDDLEALDAEDVDSHFTPPAVDPLDVAAIVYTSGTTSRPKGVMVRHAAYTESGRSFPGWLGLAEPQRLWACLPLFHINAQAYSLMTALAHGYTLALTPRFHASSFWQDARRLRVTEVNVVGAMLQFVANQPESAWVESPLRTIYAAPGPPPGERELLERRFKVRILTGYGMSENPFGCAESPTSRLKVNSIGRPRQPASGAFENQLRIERPAGGMANPGEVGELCFRNPVMTPGYWNAPEVTSATLKDGWLHTGDAGYQDEDGDVFLSGRYKEMIRRRGENIAPGEVEDALRSHAAVSEAAAFGVPAGMVEDEVVAVVVLKEGAAVEEGELRAWVGTRLAPFKIPSRIYFRDALPMTPTHRVARDALRKEYANDVSPS